MNCEVDFTRQWPKTAVSATSRSICVQTLRRTRSASCKASCAQRKSLCTRPRRRRFGMGSQGKIRLVFSPKRPPRNRNAEPDCISGGVDAVKARLAEGLPLCWEKIPEAQFETL